MSSYEKEKFQLLALDIPSPTFDLRAMIERPRDSKIPSKMPIRKSSLAADLRPTKPESAIPVAMPRRSPHTTPRSSDPVSTRKTASLAANQYERQRARPRTGSAPTIPDSRPAQIQKSRRESTSQSDLDTRPSPRGPPRMNPDEVQTASRSHAHSDTRRAHVQLPGTKLTPNRTHREHAAAASASLSTLKTSPKPSPPSSSSSSPVVVAASLSQRTTTASSSLTTTSPLINSQLLSKTASGPSIQSKLPRPAAQTPSQSHPIRLSSSTSSLPASTTTKIPGQAGLPVSSSSYTKPAEGSSRAVIQTPAKPSQPNVTLSSIGLAASGLVSSYSPQHTPSHNKSLDSPSTQKFDVKRLLAKPASTHSHSRQSSSSDIHAPVPSGLVASSDSEHLSTPPMVPATTTPLRSTASREGLRYATPRSLASASTPVHREPSSSSSSSSSRIPSTTVACVADVLVKRPRNVLRRKRSTSPATLIPPTSSASSSTPDRRGSPLRPLDKPSTQDENDSSSSYYPKSHHRTRSRSQGPPQPPPNTTSAPIPTTAPASTPGFKPFDSTALGKIVSVGDAKDAELPASPWRLDIIPNRKSAEAQQRRYPGPDDTLDRGREREKVKDPEGGVKNASTGGALKTLQRKISLSGKLRRKPDVAFDVVTPPQPPQTSTPTMLPPPRRREDVVLSWTESQARAQAQAFARTQAISQARADVQPPPQTTQPVVGHRKQPLASAPPPRLRQSRHLSLDMADYGVGLGGVKDVEKVVHESGETTFYLGAKLKQISSNPPSTAHSSDGHTSGGVGSGSTTGAVGSNQPTKSKSKLRSKRHRGSTQDVEGRKSIDGGSPGLMKLVRKFSTGMLRDRRLGHDDSPPPLPGVPSLPDSRRSSISDYGVALKSPKSPKSAFIEPSGFVSKIIRSRPSIGHFQSSSTPTSTPPAARRSFSQSPRDGPRPSNATETSLVSSSERLSTRPASPRTSTSSYLPTDPDTPPPPLPAVFTGYIMPPDELSHQLEKKPTIVTRVVPTLNLNTKIVNTKSPTGAHDLTTTPTMPVSAVIDFPSLPFPPRRADKPRHSSSRSTSPVRAATDPTPRKKPMRPPQLESKKHDNRNAPRYVPVPGEENALQLDSRAYLHPSEHSDLDSLSPMISKSPRSPIRSLSSVHRPSLNTTGTGTPSSDAVEHYRRRIRRSSMDSPSPTATSGFLTSGSYRFREIPTTGVKQRSEKEKDKMWAELMARSERAGGTLHAAAPDANRLV